MAEDDGKPATRVQRALKLEEVPPEKWHNMAARTAIGTLFLALGGFLVFMLWRVFTETKTLSLALLIAGPTFLAIGAHIFSGQILARSIVSLAEPLRVIRDFWKGPGQ
jgi:polyferredoxin